MIPEWLAVLTVVSFGCTALALWRANRELRILRHFIEPGKTGSTSTSQSRWWWDISASSLESECAHSTDAEYPYLWRSGPVHPEP